MWLPAVGRKRLVSGFLFSALLPSSSPLLHARQKPPAPTPHLSAATPQTDNPVASAPAIVTAGHARFTVLTPQLIRMEWSADSKFEDHASFVFINRRLPVPQFKQSFSGGVLHIDTSDLHLQYRPASATDGSFTAENLTVTFTLNGSPVTWRPGMPDKGNLLGTTRTLDGALGSATKEPIQPGLISRDGWVVVDDSERPLFDSANFDFTRGEQSPWPWVLPRNTQDKHQDLYFFGYGHDYKQALADYVKVAGRIPLPPRFAFGAWWSRYWPYTDQELDRLVRGFRQDDVPLDVLVIDMDWHLNREQLAARGEKDQSGQRLGWTGYTWNNLLFPHPQEFLADVHKQGIKATLNLHPASGVQPWETPYPAMARAMGIDPATRKYVPFDIADKKYAANYMDLLHHPLEKQGIDFWWLDWQQEPTTSIPGVNPTWWLNYVHFTDQEREGKRPMLFHRWGGLGNHRYQIGFSGDTVSVWDSLAYQPQFTATAANVGYAYWSHDIGGHMPGAVEPELYLRWLQFGVFSPILRTHTTRNPDAERRIWAYPEPYADHMREAIHLRYALEPYLYTEGRRTYDTGLAFLHPLYYDWPNANEAYTNTSEYRFGESFLVAPVTHPADKDNGLASESVWIPEGDWIEWSSGKHFTGPLTVERKFSIDQIPAYVRAGAIVPMQPPMRYTGEKPVDPLILSVFPLRDGETSTYTLYEDNGHSVDYKHGVCAWTPLSARRHANELEVTVSPVRGSYPGMLRHRGYELRLPGDWPPSSVTVNGRSISFAGKIANTGWTYDGNTLTTVIHVPDTSVAAGVSIKVTRSSTLVARDADLNGFAGKMIRLRAAYDAINEATGRVPDPMIEATQTGDRLSYAPQSAAQELSRLPQLYSQASAAAQELVTEAALSDQALAQKYRLPAPASSESQARIVRFRANARRSLALLQDANTNP